MGILEKIANGKRMPILFIGSGISRRYLYHYPNWEELLRLSFAKVNSDPYYYQKHVDALKRKSLSDFEINAALGSIIENDFNNAFFEHKIKIPGVGKNPTWVKNGVSPYKMFLAMHFKRLHVNTNQTLQEELTKFRSLKNKISAIITTNYDSFLEKEIFADDYHVFIHQNELFSCDSYNTAEIYKIHGCISDAESIIITKEDYAAFTESRKLIIAKMLTLFSESPIIFLGYSFTDIDVQNIISDFLGCLSKKDLENINEHFVFISYKPGQMELKEIQRTITTSKGTEIPITDIETDNYSLIYDILSRITPGISPIKIRETKRLVKTIVDQSVASNDAESLIIGIDELNDANLDSKPLAIAVGYKENILNKYGYDLLDESLIFEDILYDNKKFDAEFMCINRFKSLAYTRLIPVYKYVKQYSGIIPKDSHLDTYISKHNKVEHIITNSAVKTLKNVPEFHDYQELKIAIDSIDNGNKKAGLLLKNIQNIDLLDARELCKRIYEYDSSLSKINTHFKRCVMYIDFIENYSERKRS